MTDSMYGSSLRVTVLKVITAIAFISMVSFVLVAAVYAKLTLLV